MLFIATANGAGRSRPLLDRMEVIRFDGYTVAEKVAIARDYLWKRQLERNGLRPEEVTVGHDMLRLIVAEYTARRASATLEREIRDAPAQAATKVASNDAGAVTVDLELVRDARPPEGVPGVRRAHGGPRCGDRPRGDRKPAATCCSSRPTRCPATGGLTLTSQLGDVMKESARIALTYVRHATTSASTAVVREPRVPHPRPRGRDPEGRARARASRSSTALASLLTGRAVKHTVGHDRRGHAAGGRVLPIGG